MFWSCKAKDIAPPTEHADLECQSDCKQDTASREIPVILRIAYQAFPVGPGPTGAPFNHVVLFRHDWDSCAHFEYQTYNQLTFFFYQSMYIKQVTNDAFFFF